MLLRYSGTETKIRLLIEGRDGVRINAQADKIAGAIQETNRGLIDAGRSVLSVQLSVLRIPQRRGMVCESGISGEEAGAGERAALKT